METLESTTCSASRTSHSNPQSSNSSSSLLPPSVLRLWRSAAQRNLRNEWPKLAALRDKWNSISSAGRHHATALVNAHLNQRYMPTMELGALSDMPDIRERACWKLSKQQELEGNKLLSSYKDLVAVVNEMVNVTKSLRCFFKGANNSPLLQFCNNSTDKNDAGDGGGIPVFTFWSISSHEELAEELVRMFALELCLKRLLVLGFLSIDQNTSQGNQLNWLVEIYDDEFNHFRVCNLYCGEIHGPVPPRQKDGKSDILALKFDNQPDPEVLQVYLSTWLAEVNIDTSRVDEIFATVGEEMHVSIC